jgi:cytochrome c peroxidase
MSDSDSTWTLDSLSIDIWRAKCSFGFEMRAVAALLVSLSLLLMSVAARAGMTQAESAALAKFRPPPTVPIHLDPAGKEKIDLGKTLFFDPILSRMSSRSCASCHNPGLSWGDGLPRAIGDNGDVMHLRAPTLLDVYQLPRLGWDGKFSDLQAVAFAAITSPANMDLPVPELLARLAKIPGYATAFEAVFPGQGMTRSTLLDAIAAYEKTIASGTAPFDRWVAGDPKAIDASAQRGFALFNGIARHVIPVGRSRMDRFTMSEPQKATTSAAGHCFRPR